MARGGAGDEEKTRFESCKLTALSSQAGEVENKYGEMIIKFARAYATTGTDSVGGAKARAFSPPIMLWMQTWGCAPGYL